MKRITHKCGCGAEAIWESESVETFQIVFDSRIKMWLDLHADCGQAKENKLLNTRLSDLEFCKECGELNLKKDLFLIGGIAPVCPKCAAAKEIKINPDPSPDPDECADRRANRGEDCFETKEAAKEHAEWLTKDQPGIFHFYSCKIGGDEHWHVEKMESDSVVWSSKIGYHWYHVDQLETWVKEARQQERERCLEIIDYTGGDSRELNRELILKGEKLK